MGSLVVLLADAPSDTFYTKSPHWGWLIVFYFFLGGLAGGSAFLGGLIDLFGARQDRFAARIGHLLAAPLIAVSGVLLIVDLNRPERFWHMLIQNNTGEPMIKYWVPISVGVWLVSLFGLFSALAFVGVAAEQGWLGGRLQGLRTLREGGIGKAISALTALTGISVAGYTGVLLADTNRPLWGDTTLLGILFLLSGVSAAAAAITLLSGRRANRETLHWLGNMDAVSSLLELLVLIVLVVSIGSVVREVWGNAWGVLVALGTVLAGILIPLVLHWRPNLLGRMSVPSAAALVLIGSFCLRAAVVIASEQS